jgi:tRNA A-37 threonylcarbamoyl transferase component Bud32
LNALKVREHGIDTPEPIGFLLNKKHGLLYDSYFISLQQPYLNLTQIRNTADIYAALGKFIAELQQRNILHLDLSFGNILLNDTEDKITFSLVDLNRMKFKKVGQSAGSRNCNRLHGNEEVLRILATSYAETRHLDEKKCSEEILKENQKHFHSCLPFHSNCPKTPIMAVAAT